MGRDEHDVITPRRRRPCSQLPRSFLLALLVAQAPAGAARAEQPDGATAAAATSGTAPALRGGASLRIEAPAALPIGASRVAVIARVPVGPVMPLLLTVRVEGEALQVVRARFLRSDARLEHTGELRFEVPVLARAPGIALLRAELSTYRCEQNCRQVRVQAALQLQVAARAR